ncbi:MAG: MerR family DNA-binding transcriptional regulator [Chloroflexi bacterium]|nr:MerR family DNA-binding transcriptional regulator [Chloroflexota bacterium]MBI3741115.1 MerR family DNA-binding transcriptional regulator [Chloroflexota bacterium]
MKTNPTAFWLGLKEASKQLGVSPATLRHWSNQGRIRAIRTPGGHRRFSTTEMKQATSSPQHNAKSAERFVHTVVGRTHLEIADGRLKKEIWYRHLNPALIEKHRDLGRRFMQLILQVLRDQEKESRYLHRAQSLGREYGKIGKQAKLSVTDALRAFLFFRDYIFEELIENRSAQMESDSDTLKSYQPLNHLANEMLIAMVETYRER